MSDIHRIHLAETDSTNRYARERVAWPGVVLITTDHQTAGRGQRGNSWESEAEKNLLFTLALPIQGIKASEQFAISELIAVSLCDVLSQYAQDIRIKWPNDIYYKDKKLSGILIEHDIEGSHIARSLIGVGLNVNQTHFVSDALNPISLAQILGHDVEREPLLQAITARFLELYEEYTSPTPMLSRDALHERYTHLLYRRNIPAEYRDANGPFTATLRHVKPDGRLVLEDEQGTLREYLFKEVAYII
jgi:BirA family biotin operon repressor/biotin-[acetyl-CoA-carboxylase] ligase